MRLSELVEDVSGIISKPYLYHVTSKSNLPAILSNGLIPCRKGVVFLSYSIEAAKNWASALESSHPVIIKLKLQDCLPIYMRDFVYTSPAKMWGRDAANPDDDKPLLYARWSSKHGGAGDLVKIESIEEFKDWLETIEAYNVDIHREQVSNYDMLEVMVDRPIPPSAITGVISV
jgi:hypothetical protein